MTTPAANIDNEYVDRLAPYIDLAEDIARGFVADGGTDGKELVAKVRAAVPAHLDPDNYCLTVAEREFSRRTGMIFDAEGTATFKIEDNPFCVDWAEFEAADVPEPRVLLKANGETCIRDASLNEIFAYRGLGKSMLVNGLIKTLITGGEFLTFSSTGGFRVLLVDGELPASLLQARLKRLVGSVPRSMLSIRSVATLEDRMPALSTPAAQEEFIQNVKQLQPDVIIFDTRTACFKHDTNDQKSLLTVNEFLVDLRKMGFAVIVTHHAGKNGTQRGRTDNDDDLDLIIKLDKRQGWQPGMGLEFALAFEKVRNGDRLDPFEAKYDDANGWQILERGSLHHQIVEMLLDGKSSGKVASELKVRKEAILTAKRRAEEAGIVFPILKPGPKKK